MRTPGEIATHLPNNELFLAIWIVGGVYAFFGAISLAEGGTIVRRSGGQYPIVHRALGPYPAFIVGWSDWFSTAASTSLAAIVFAEFASPLLPAIPGGIKIIACSVVLFLGFLQWTGVKTGDIAQQLLSALKALAFTALIVAGLMMTIPPAAVSAPLPLASGTGLVAAVVLALQGVILTYDGWTGPLYFGEETVDVGRTLPRAMISGVLVVMLIYVMFNLTMLRVVGINAMAGDPFVAGTAGTILFGGKGDLIIRVAVLIAVVGGINSNLLFACRIPLAMSRDGLLPERMNQVNAGGTPAIAHAVSIIAALAFIVTGTFSTVLALVAFFFVANYVFSFLSIFALRRNEPDIARPYRAWGFPYTTGLVLIGSIAFLIGAIFSDRRNSMNSLILLALSFPTYLLIMRFKQRNSTP